MFAAGVKSPIVASCSTSAGNAEQIWKEVAYQIRHNKNLNDICKITRRPARVFCEKLNAEYVALAGGATGSKSAEGIGASIALVDELGWHLNADLYRAVEYNQIERPDGMMVSISTASDSIDHFYHDVYSHAKDILAGRSLDITTYAEVYEADPDKPIEDQSQWFAANPSLTQTNVTLESFQNDMDAAKTNFGPLQNWKLRRLNLWVSTDDLNYIQPNEWAACTVKPMSDDELAKYPCGFGNDLSQAEDPSSVSLCWQLPGDRYYVKSWGFVCQEGWRQREKSLKSKYDDFRAEGSMYETDGSMIDRDFILKFILDKAAKFHPIKMNFDATGALTMMESLVQMGFNCERWGPTARWFNEPMKLVESMVKDRRLSHDGSKYMAWGINNVRCEVNTHDEVRVNASRSCDHVDSAVSMLMAFGAVYVGTQKEEAPIKVSPITFTEVKPARPQREKPFWTDRSWC